MLKLLLVSFPSCREHGGAWLGRTTHVVRALRQYCVIGFSLDLMSARINSTTFEELRLPKELSAAMVKARHQSRRSTFVWGGFFLDCLYLFPGFSGLLVPWSCALGPLLSRSLPGPLLS